MARMNLIRNLLAAISIYGGCVSTDATPRAIKRDVVIICGGASGAGRLEDMGQSVVLVEKQAILIITIIIITITTTRTITTNTTNKNNMPSRTQRAAAARARAARAARAAAAAADAAADAAAAVAPEPEPEPEPDVSPAPAPPAAPAARPARVRPARGARRAVPCLGCLRSALAGRSSGECYDAAVGSRCWRCASGHTCTQVPAVARAAAVRFVEALENNAPRREVDRLRTAVRVLLEGGKEEEEVAPPAPAGSVTPAPAGGAAPAGDPAAVRAQVLALMGQILDLLLPQQQQQ
ncbi:hypothetical protein DL767_009437 [Monosporascus sp. MG133]|nr:hypothetical protein DL767_009437 [Monosporascus sp. MG133]